jgi:nucleotide-binding universal stress UspA family protein
MLQNRFKKILVALDGSPNSIKGLNEAISLARLSNGVITGIYVINAFPPEYSIDDKKYKLQLIKHAKKCMNHAEISAARHGVNYVEKITTSKNPIDTIVGFAMKNNFDIIILGSRGLGSPKAQYIGSVAHGVVNNSKVPILIVK